MISINLKTLLMQRMIKDIRALLLHLQYSLMKAKQKLAKTCLLLATRQHSASDTQCSSPNHVFLKRIPVLGIPVLIELHCYDNFDVNISSIVRVMGF